MMTKSTVVDNETGKSVDSTVRTSTGTFFAREQDQTIAAIEKRISMVGDAVALRCDPLLACSLSSGCCTSRAGVHPGEDQLVMRMHCGGAGESPARGERGGHPDPALCGWPEV